MKLEVKQNAVDFVKCVIAETTSTINQNRKQINKLSDENAALKRVRVKQIKLLVELEKM